MVCVTISFAHTRAVHCVSFQPGAAFRAPPRTLMWFPSRTWVWVPSMRLVVVAWYSHSFDSEDEEMEGLSGRQRLGEREIAKLWKCFRHYRLFVSRVLSRCCKTRPEMFHMLQWQNTYVACLCFMCFRYMFNVSPWCFKSKSWCCICCNASSACFKCFTCYLRIWGTYHLNIAKVDLVLHILLWLYTQLKYFICFSHTLQGFGLDIFKSRSQGAHAAMAPIVWGQRLDALAWCC